MDSHSVFVGLFAATNLGLAVWKAKLFSDYYGGIKTSIVFYVLLLEIIANASKLVNITRVNLLPISQ